LCSALQVSQRKRSGPDNPLLRVQPLAGPALSIERTGIGASIFESRNFFWKMLVTNKGFCYLTSATLIGNPAHQSPGSRTFPKRIGTK
jgi:hypothetical protein